MTPTPVRKLAVQQAFRYGGPRAGSGGAFYRCPSCGRLMTDGPWRCPCESEPAEMAD